MSNAPVLKAVSTLSVSDADPFRITDCGLIISGEPSFDAWRNFGERLCREAAGLQWCIGDWLVYGGGRGEWGAKYDEAIKQLGRSYRTLRKEAAISEKFQLGRRRPNLSWSHHSEVESLPVDVADALLVEAEEKDWSRKDIRERVAERKEPDPPEPFHILDAVGKLKDAIDRMAATWPETHRRVIPGILRDVANDMERQ